MTLVFNASPLIVLAKSGLLEATIELADRLMIPKAVFDEVNRHDDPADAASIWLRSAKASECIAETSGESEFIAAWGLGAGESSVISLTEKTPGSTAVLDDLAARRCATALGLHIIGALGLLLMAKRSGHIRKVSEALDAVVTAGLYISEKHLSEIRRLAGE